MPEYIRRPSGPMAADARAARMVFPVDVGTTSTKNTIHNAKPETPRTQPAEINGLAFSRTEMQKAAATSNMSPMSSIMHGGSFRLQATAQTARPRAVPAINPNHASED